MSKCKPEVKIPTEADIQRLVERYFIVFFKAETKNGAVEGHLNIECKSFPNYIEIKSYIYDSYETDNCAITNIIELSKEDYLDWNYEDE